MVSDQSEPSVAVSLSLTTSFRDLPESNNFTTQEPTREFDLTHFTVSWSV